MKTLVGQAAVQAVLVVTLDPLQVVLFSLHVLDFSLSQFSVFVAIVLSGEWRSS